MNIPNPVKITPEEGEALANLHKRQSALQQFVQMVTQQGEMQIQQIMKDGQSIWSALGQKYNLDLENIVWDYDDKRGQIVPMRMNLK